ncbi:MAG: DUF3160 domain-containing protein [Sandaracinaceae bacterium]
MSTTPVRTSPLRLLLLLPALALGCATPPDPGPGAAPGAFVPGGSDPQGVPIEPGVAVDPPPVEVPQDLQDALDEAARATADGLLDARRVPFEPIAYDPLEAINLDLIQDSGFALTPDEEARFARDGFVLMGDRLTFPTFGDGLSRIYEQDLPVYVTADALMEAVHRSFDHLLKDIEIVSLVPSLGSLLASMHEQLPGADLDAAVARDVDLYLAVARSLLTGEDVAPLAGARPGPVRSFVSGAEQANGLQVVELFGVERRVDLSQFRPRGHYTDDEVLERYFRAMMWLGRIDLRFLETQDDGSVVFHRRQVDAAVALASLMGEAEQERWATIDQAVGAFVGQPDMMVPGEVAALLGAVGAETPAAFQRVPDEAIVEALSASGLGIQQIASHIIVNRDPDGTPLPLNRSFALLPQRYVVDSHVFANVVFDRVQHEGLPPRLMPSPLDIAYAVLRNPQAVPLVIDELATYGYAPELEAMHVLVGAHGDAYGDPNLYNLWLSSLRELSPPSGGEGFAEGTPSVARTEAWGRRLLNAQLASWAELRRDTILYAKQSYTSGIACAFPDAYVDPYPAFYGALERYADEGLALVRDLPGAPTGVEAYFANLGAAARTLKGMAEQELAGLPFTDEQMMFINQAVAIEAVCGSTFLTGWYAQLHYGRRGDEHVALVDEPVAADVHTQPTDEAGNFVGRVLHVGVDRPAPIVVSVETCEGVRAYVGLVHRYREHITEDFRRLDDDDWAETLPLLDEVPWMAELYRPAE